MRWIMKYILILPILILSSSTARAETIYFKDGHIVQGQVISKDNVNTVIKEGNFPKKYYNFLIDHIEQDKLSGEGAVIKHSELAKITDKKELIRLYLEANGTKASMKENFDAVIAKAQGEKKEKLKAMLDIDKIFELLVAVYDKHFNEEELRTLIEFYQSPVGGKLVSLGQTLLQETMDVSVIYFKEKEGELERSNK